MSAKTKTKTKIESDIKRYLFGILFIMIGVFIISAVSYIASIVPPQTFPPSPTPPPKPTDPFNGTTPSGLSFRQKSDVVLNNQDSFMIQVSGGVLATATVYAVVDLNTLNGANATSATFYYTTTSSPRSGGQYYKCNYYVAYYSLGLTDDPVNYIKITLNRPTTANATVYVYVSGSYIDFSNNLVCYVRQSPPFSISNTLFLSFIGWAFGIVFVIAGVHRLGLRI